MFDIKAELKKLPNQSGVYIMHGDKDEILYIGDSEVDIQTAKNAQIEFLTVSWGFRETDYLLNNGAKEIVDTALEIINFV